MKTAIEFTEATSHSEAAKSVLREGFEQFMEKLSQAQLLELARKGNQQNYFDTIRNTLAISDGGKLSPKMRNQIAYAKGKELALEKVKDAYELLGSKTVCQILGITRQALNKKVQQCQVLSYTDASRRKYYPSFQFESNAVIPQIWLLAKAVSVNSKTEEEVNTLLGFLAQDMDFSNPGEPENLKPRYMLLADEEAFEIIVRDFRNRLSMGR
jgi:hypothetical protein